MLSEYLALDVLIECELKQVISNSAVQSFTGDLWKGAIKDWPGWKSNLLALSMMAFPPIWIVFSLPLDTKYHKTPFIKFLGSVTSHFYFMVFQVLTSCIPIYPIFRFI